MTTTQKEQDNGTDTEGPRRSNDDSARRRRQHNQRAIPWDGSFPALSDYDQDHRGFWGASSVAASSTPALLREIARDLIDQAIEDAAMNDEQLEGAEEEDL